MGPTVEQLQAARAFLGDDGGKDSRASIEGLATVLAERDAAAVARIRVLETRAALLYVVVEAAARVLNRYENSNGRFDELGAALDAVSEVSAHRIGDAR